MSKESTIPAVTKQTVTLRERLEAKVRASQTKAESAYKDGCLALAELKAKKLYLTYVDDDGKPLYKSVGQYAEDILGIKSATAYKMAQVGDVLRLPSVSADIKELPMSVISEIGTLTEAEISRLDPSTLTQETARQQSKAIRDARPRKGGKPKDKPSYTGIHMSISGDTVVRESVRGIHLDGSYAKTVPWGDTPMYIRVDETGVIHIAIVSRDEPKPKSKGK